MSISLEMCLALMDESRPMRARGVSFEQGAFSLVRLTALGSKTWYAFKEKHRTLEIFLFLLLQLLFMKIKIVCGIGQKKVGTKKGTVGGVLILVSFLLMPFSDLSADSSIPRYVLGIYDSQQQKPRLLSDNEGVEEFDSHDGEVNPIQQNLAVVLNHMGYLVEQLDIRNHPLPDAETMKRYAMVISWFRFDITVPNPEKYVPWVELQVKEGRKFLVLEYPGIEDNLRNLLSLKKRLYRAIGLEFGNSFRSKTNRIQLVNKISEMVEFEHLLRPPFPWYDLFRPLNVNIKSYLTVKYWLDKKSESIMVMTSPQGGMVAPGYLLFSEAAPPFRKKWKINPFLLMKSLLKSKFPIPDVTTIKGKRIFYSHIDGDGFRSISSVQYKKIAAEVILEKIIQKFPGIPIGVSVVVGDIDPDWWGNPKFIEIAREIFSQPNVEAATHTYTHPYQWQRWNRSSAYAPLGAFRYEREIDESIEWIEEHLLPSDKQVKLVYWSGDTTPPEEALVRVENFGKDHLNGGDSRKDNDYPSYTTVAPLMRPAGKRWQIFTSASNENLYTALWTAKFHGFRNVIQTFENTNSPIRLAPVNVYYHFYIAEKVASMQSLEQVLDWVQQQDLYMIYPSEYVQLVRGFISTELYELEPALFEIRNRGTLQTFRLDLGKVDLERSQGVRAIHQVNGNEYIDLDPEVEKPRIAIMR
ncbi:MAG: hypothetical protein HQM13_01785 [SAR324 cluster bacterium]|nr:hypothetical protein [SAR324 cluster bacterium]